MELQKLTKAEILQGIEKTHEVEVEELGGVVIIRPLRESEWAEIESIQLKGLNLTGKGDPNKEDADDVEMEMGMDLSAMTKYEYMADRMAVASGLSCDGEKWNPNDVGKLPAGVVKKLAKKVYEVSGVTSEKQSLIENFPPAAKG